MRRNAALVTAATLAAVLTLGGCSWFKSDKKVEAAAAEQAASEEIYAPIETVRDIEIGRTRNGYAIAVHGIAPGLGYGAPELRVRRDGKLGPDGFIDFDFVVKAPDANFNLGEGPVEARVIRADLHITARDLQGAVGIRVHGVSGGLMMRF